MKGLKFVKQNDKIVETRYFNQVVKLGDEVYLTILNSDFDTDICSVRKVFGTVIQLTSNFALLSLKNGEKESFQYSDIFELMDYKDIENSLQPERDVPEDCIDDLFSKGRGFVFTKSQCKDVLEFLDKRNLRDLVKIEVIDDIIYFVDNGIKEVV